MTRLILITLALLACGATPDTTGPTVGDVCDSLTTLACSETEHCPPDWRISCCGAECQRPAPVRPGEVYRCALAAAPASWSALRRCVWGEWRTTLGERCATLYEETARRCGVHPFAEHVEAARLACCELHGRPCHHLADRAWPECQATCSEPFTWALCPWWGGRP